MVSVSSINTSLKKLFGIQASNIDSKLGRSISISFLIRFFSVVISFFFIPLAVNALDKREFGVWLVIFSFVSWLSLFESSVINHLRNELIKNSFKNGTDEAKNAFINAIIILSSANVFILFLMILLNLTGSSDYILNLVNIKYKGVDKVVFLTVIGYSLQMIFKVFNGILLADHKSHILGFITLVSSLFSFVLIYLLTFWGKQSLLTFSTIQSFAPILVYAILLKLYIFKKYKYIIFNHVKFTVDLISSFRGSTNFLILQITSTLMFTSGSLIVAHYFSAESVTTYSIAAKYYSIIPTIYGVLITPYWSAFTEAYTSSNKEWIIKTMNRLNTYSLCASIIVIALFFLQEILLKIWIGSNAEIPSQLSVAFLIYTISYTFLSNYNYFTNAIGKFKLTIALSIFGAILFFPLNDFLIRMLNMGVSSIIWVSTAWCLSLTFCCFWEYKSVIKQIELVNTLPISKAL